MKLRTFSLLGVAALLATPVFGTDWKIKADYAETCSCDVVCPCLFGGDPTHRECLGQGVIRVRKGHYGDVDLGGVTVHCAFKMGEWERYTVSDTATPEQAAAMRTIIEKVYSTLGAEIVSYKQGPVSFKEEDGKILFGTTGSEAVLEPVAGADGTPVRIENLAMFPEYKQYRSVKNEHKSETKEFSVSGTNGLTSVQTASSEDSAD